MCTTYLATLIIEELQEKGMGLVEYPRLVRLNPNIPWKTRGNGALAMRVGRIADDMDKKIKIGNRYYLYDTVERCSAGEVFDIVRAAVEKHSCFDDEKTNPGFVISEGKPLREFYERCAREVVELGDALAVLEGIDAMYKGYKNRRGLIGATAAIAYEPSFSTYELIAYRKNESTGKRRFIEKDSVIEMDRRFPETFDNYDYENDHVCIAPNSPCPVLFGVRGVSPDLSGVLSVLRTEEVERWIVYQTNQGTDEHLKRRSVGDIKEHTSGIITGRVKTRPRVIKGGHVIFELADEESTIYCAAYEPTKQFRSVVLKLMPGDMVELYGGMSLYRTFNIEKMRVIDVVRILKNPKCCGVSMKSMGKGKGFRCEKCGRRTKEGRVVFERDLKPGFYEVPPCARRHISMPLKVMGMLPDLMGSPDEGCNRSKVIYRKAEHTKL
jgi:tRNA(Ile2)-agmatinylcytidine synthase